MVAGLTLIGRFRNHLAPKGLGAILPKVAVACGPGLCIKVAPPPGLEQNNRE